MQVGHEDIAQASDYEMNEFEGTQLDDIISSANFPADYDAFSDENLDMIP